MKKKFFTLLLLFLSIVILYAENKKDVVIHPTSSESTQGDNKPARSPIRIPSVSIEEYDPYYGMENFSNVKYFTVEH